ncbi:MAG: alpha/beta fold hydrolase [Solirubrobacterales bacterium]|nr:alpha/beta fold hydrolase [Solirubrobacterales bacterium]
MAVTTRPTPPTSDNGGAAGRGTSGETEDRAHAPVDGVALDMLLTEAATGPAQRWVPGRAVLNAAFNLARRPRLVARRGTGLAADLARITAGRSELAPAKGDRRFKDPAWVGNPAFRRLGQAYLAAAAAIDQLVDDAELDWAQERRLRFAASNLMDAVAPTNFPLTNPAVLKAVLDTGGKNFARGLEHFLADMSRPPRIPSMVNGDSFEVGENLAVTPGAVIFRTEVFELIQYEPQTATVRERPLLVVPPMINKYYVTDLAPGRSMIEHAVQHGQQVFAISWRNPDKRHAGWNLDTYVRAVVEALDAVQEIAGCEQAHALGLCAGGIVLATAAAHLAARTPSEERLAGLTLAVCVLDNARAGTTSAFLDRRAASMAIADSARRGYLDGRALAGVFAWLRPNDLIWNYWVNNYLVGNDPPAFDVLYWNADTTNLPAALHRDFVELSLENSLVHPGRLKALGTPVDLSKLTLDTYLVAGITDHITPWENCYRSTQLLGSSPRFVLSTSGHIAAMVNPPSNERASYHCNDHNPPAPEEWMHTARREKGTWWLDWSRWLAERSGEEKPAPVQLGTTGLPPLDPAPGTYVLAKQ